MFLAIVFAIATLVPADTAAARKTFLKAFDEYFKARQLDRCIDAANSMLARSAPNDPDRAFYLYMRGVGYSELGDAADADRDLSDALALAEVRHDVDLLARIHRQRGMWIWRYKKNLPATLHEYDEAMAYAARANATDTILTLENAYGNLFRYSDHVRALDHYQRGLAVAQKLRDEQMVAYFLKNSGDIYRQEGNFDQANAALVEAEQIADRRNVQQVRWMARNQLGILWAKRDVARAESYFNEAFALLEEEQSGVLLDDLRPGLFEGELRYANPYDEAIAMYSTHQRFADAFHIAERERARVFLETLAANREGVRAAVPAGFAAKEKSALDRIKSAQAALRANPLTEPQRAALIAQVEHAESDLTALRLRLAVEQPSLAEVRYPKLWRVDELQARLIAPDEAFVAFHIPHGALLNDRRAIAWVITRGSMVAIDLPARAAIDSAARAALGELRNPYARAHSNVAALSRVLNVAAIASAAHATRLVIIPDGILHEIPFEALTDERGTALVERFAISYAPSASALAFLRSLPPHRGAATLVAIANPVIGRRQPDTRRQIVLAQINALSPLEHAANEVRAIARLFGRSVLTFEGPSAKRAELERAPQLRQARIIHFATHGLIDDAQPLRSGLVLTADPPHDDGLLQMRDIYSMRITADLVTLSACETALGENVTGEGIIGLTRAFFFAGARAVASSLWSVDDAATSRFMKQFYTHVRDGEPIDIALQRTKVHFIRDGGTRASPFFWAAFVVSGNARTALPPPSSSMPAVAIAIAAVGLAAFAAGWRMRRAATTRAVDVRHPAR